jgi:hypothetical protein
MRRMGFRAAFVTVVVFAAMAVTAAGCTAGVAHNIAVVLPTPHLNTDTGTARQFGNLYFFTDRNIPDTSLAYNALLAGKTAEAMNMLARIEGSNLPDIQRAYWQNDVAVCFILEGRYKEADELLVQAGMLADEEAIRYNHRVSVYLNESQALFKKRSTQNKPQVAPAGDAAAGDKPKDEKK